MTVDLDDPGGRHVTVLGATTFAGHDGTVEVDGPKARTLATLLAMNAGSVVADESILDALWDGEPPVSATKNVHLYVCRLRKRIAEATGSRSLLCRTSVGYRLRVAPADVDAIRVVRGAARGTAALADGEVATAADLLTAALAAWPKDALSGLVPSRPIDAIVTSLRERRLSAIEHLAAARLAAGATDGAIELLLPHSIENPVREPAHLMLMRTLVAAGHRAIALELFYRLRRSLQDELGIEPGAEIQQVFAAILCDETIPSPRLAPAREQLGVIRRH